jgi:hypothetical protein
MVRVKVQERVYEMTEDALKGLLRIAAENVPCGVYAIRRGNYVELRNDRMTKTKLKAVKRSYRQEGWKVYANQG